MKIQSITSIYAAFVCALMLGFMPAIGGAETVFEKLYIFGDSLSDPGNAYALTGQTSKAPYEAIPEAPYAIGGHHFSNGKTWAERLAQNLNANNGGKPALAKPGRYGNYAFGGARARDSGTSPSSSAQVGMFLGDHGGVAPSDGLYVLQFGGNDIRDALFDPLNAGSFVLSAVAAEIGNIQMLYLSGARNFAIVNAPNLGRAPAVVASGQGAVAGAEALSQFHNEVLEHGFPALGLPGLSQLEGLPGIKIYRIDFFSFVNDVADNPTAFGISDPFFPCLLFGVKSEAKCDNPDERAFWDGIHPTAVIHSALGDVATAVVTID